MIHRDLKPSNVMVGSFGEVQVMDWGLAKLLPRGGATDDRSAGITPSETVIATARSLGGGDLSMAGSVMGTPSYMAPEQARGESLDERADVFALGSILAEILTGRPAFAGRTPGEIRRKAARADTAEALHLLDSSGSDSELLALAHDCLAAEPDDRPADAGIIADRLSAHLAGVQARVQAAERDRAVAQAQAVEERRRRRLQAGLAASVLALAVVGGLATSYVTRQRQATAAAVDRALGETTTLLGLAREHPEDPAGWKLALAAARRVEDGPGAARLAGARSQAEAGLGDAERDASLRQTLVESRANVQDAGAAETDVAYAATFRAAGLDLDTLAVPEAAARLRRRSPAVAVELAAYLDHWAQQRQEAGRPDSDRGRLVEVARAADPDSFRDRVRASLVEGDAQARANALKALVADPRSGDLPAVTAVSLAAALADPAEAVALLRKAAARHPGDVWVNFTLAEALDRLRPAAVEEAIRYYSVARALRPETAHALAHLLDRAGRAEEAEATFRDLVARRPDVLNLGCLGKCLKQRGRSVDARTVFDRAIRAGREAIRLRPDDAKSRYNLGNALDEKGEVDAAVAEYREAIRLRLDHADAHNNLGLALARKGEVADAIAAYREAIRLEPHDAKFHFNLGLALAGRGEVDAAVAAYREAIRLEAHDAKFHFNLGNALDEKGEVEVDAAIAAYREAIRLEPDHSSAHVNLGNALNRKGEVDTAVAAYREAIRLKPGHARAHFNLGRALTRKGEVDAAIAAYREAIRLEPDLAEAHCNLAQILKSRGEYDEALAEYRRGHELGSRWPDWKYPSADWVREAERDVALTSRLAGVLAGTDRPADAGEMVTFAGLCQFRGRHAAASRIFSDAFAADPKLAEDLGANHRYNASCSAALAGTGRSKDDPPPDEVTKAGLRDRARDWLRADLALHARAIDGGTPEARAQARRSLSHWKADADLAGIRDAAELAKLPEPEREAWRALWAEVGALRARAEGPKP